MIITACNGLCMAIADSVPGVSGGTIAFVLGFYEQFIDALHDLFGKEREVRKAAFLYLMKLGAGWCPGMLICVLLLSNLFANNIYFMSSVFLGLTVASIPFIVSSEMKVLCVHGKNILFMFPGIALVVGITLLRTDAGSLGAMDFLQLQPSHFLYIFLTGMVAITTMVLPGISGSTILLISGIYLPAIDAVKQLFKLNFAELPGLFTLDMGILAGIGVSIHCIRTALEKHRSQTVYLILGLMTGSLFAIAMGPTSLAKPVPALSASSFNFLGFAIGTAILVGVELLRMGVPGKKTVLRTNNAGGRGK